jgi:hypothetical protein
MFTSIPGGILRAASARIADHCVQLFAPTVHASPFGEPLERGIGARLSRELAACAIHHNDAKKRPCPGSTE